MCSRKCKGWELKDSCDFCPGFATGLALSFDLMVEQKMPLVCSAVVCLHCVRELLQPLVPVERTPEVTSTLFSDSPNIGACIRAELLILKWQI